MESFKRTAALVGRDNFEKLKSRRVAVFGVGGVGSYVLETLARAGIGTIDVFDNDIVEPSNINRQLIATVDTVKMQKTDAAELRAKSINPEIKINKYNLFYLPDNADNVDLSCYDYIVDAVDTVSAKVELAKRAEQGKIPIISVMGTGNKTDPSAFSVSDIFKTEVCPLCRVMRAELRKKGVFSLRVVWSPEPPVKPVDKTDERLSGRPSPASNPFCPAAAGIIAASTVFNDLVK